VGKLKLQYRVLQWLPEEQVVLRGTCALFTVTDTICVAPTKTGSQLDYAAEFEFKPLLQPLESLMESALVRMGKHSIEGLRHALESGYQVPRLSTTARLADTCIVPGVAKFSKLGYRQAKKNWHPDSAYLGGRHMVLTGATSGIGLAAARELAKRGASLTLVARDPQRGEKVIEQLLAETGNQNLHLEIADMSLMSDVQALVERLLRSDRPVDVLINNAGALFNPRQETPEGLEKSLALLLLGPYLLSEGLLPLLKRSTGARIINVVSGGMYTQKLDVSKLQGKDSSYSGSVAYARAKRALMIQTEQWAQAWGDKGIVCNAMHPGWADTPGVAQALPASPTARTC
jgi:NAD(P)-dependent dehydrogenase (short-subunit alcohol dehydrogenase family)